MPTYSNNCLHFHYNLKRNIVYRRLDFLDLPGYRVGTDGSIWTRLQIIGHGLGGGTFSTLDKKWRKMKSAKKGSYRNLSFGNKSKVKYITLHRLILLSFAGSCQRDAVCRHLNGDPSDNRIENLRWGTSKQNSADRERHGRTSKRQGEANAMVKLTDNTVKTIKLIWNASNEDLLDLSSRLSIIHNVSLQTIINIVKGVSWKHILPNLTLRSTGGRKGHHNGNAKLDEGQVAYIKYKWQQNTTLGATKFSRLVSTEFSVNFDTIYNIIKGETWSHVRPTPISNK